MTRNSSSSRSCLCQWKSPSNTPRRTTASFTWVSVRLAQGSMLADSRSMLMVGDWWLTVFPGLGIMLAVLATQLLGDWLRIRLDPQSRNL